MAKAVHGKRHLLLDFDGVMFGVRPALLPDVRGRAIAALLEQLPHRPMPIPAEDRRMWARPL